MTKKDQLDFEQCKELLYRIVDEKLDIPLEYFLSNIKTRELANTRRVVVKILKMNFPNSKVETLGKAVNRNHANVCVQLKKHEDLIYSDKIYASLFHKINDEFFLIYKKDDTDYIDYLRKNKSILEDKLKYINLQISEIENK
nr:hypothetical protein [uncultured archaeon]